MSSFRKQISSSELLGLRDVPDSPPLAGERAGFSPRGWLDWAAKQLVRAKKSRWMTHDALVAAAAMQAGWSLSPKGPGGEAPLEALAALALMAVLAGNAVGLYDRQVFLSRAKLAIALAAAAALSVLGASTLLHVVVLAPTGRWVWIIAGGAYFLGALPARAVTHLFGEACLLRVLFVGDPSEGGALAGYFGKAKRRGHHELIGFCAEGPPADALGGLESIAEACERFKADELVVSEELLPRREVLERCFEAGQHGVVIRAEGAFVEEVAEQVPVDHINERWFYGARFGCWSHSHLFLKRLLDIGASAAGLVLLFPAMAAIWLLTRATSPGPGIYSQVRCGRYNKPFRIYKFRTMRQDAEKDGARWAAQNDPRVTGLGRLLRKTRLDELPQLWNVLRGDMSLVGPRPERPEMMGKIEKDVPYFTFRQWMRPGLTGLGQIRAGYGASVDDARVKLQHDLYYIKNFNILLDLQILLRTVAVIARGSR